MAIKRFKRDNFGNGIHSEFFIDSADDLEVIEDIYDCELGDKAFTPASAEYVRHSDEFEGDLWILVSDQHGSDSSGGDGGVFTINFTTDDGWSTIEADKTFAETLAAVNSGATVYAVALEMDEGAVAYAYTMPCISSSDATISFDNYYIQAQDNQLWVSRVDYFSTGSMEYTFKKYTLTPNV